MLNSHAGEICIQFAESRWLALFIFGYDSFEPHKEIVDCFCSSQSMFHQDFSWWTSGLNHIDDSFLHCLVFKEHRRIASAVRRSFFTGDSTILLHPRGIVKHLFEFFWAACCRSVRQRMLYYTNTLKMSTSFWKIFIPCACQWINIRHNQSSSVNSRCCKCATLFT